MKGGTQMAAADLPSPLLPARRRLPGALSRPPAQARTRPTPSRGGAGQQGPEHPASSTSALSPPAPAGAPQARSTQQAACRGSARAAAPVLEPLTICSEPALCEPSPGRHCRLLARRAAPHSPGGARRSPGGPARGLSKARSEAEAASPCTPGAARRGRLSLPGRGRSERRRRQCSRQHRQESLPLFLPPALPEQAGHTWETHRDGRATRRGPGPRPRSLGAQHWGPAADCPQSLHVLKREINAGETVQGSFQF